MFACEEIWKKIACAPVYSVSSRGRVKNDRTGRILADSDWSGYRTITLRVNGHRLAKKVHRLVAEAFLPNPENKPQINHIDGSRNNNRVDNLEWCTQSHNLLHASSLGRLGMKGTRHHKARLNEHQVRDIIRRLQSGETQHEVAAAFNVSRSAVSLVASGVNWSHLQISRGGYNAPGRPNRKKQTQNTCQN
jgi:hypothetical protein